jgi:hypothetical protein
VKILLGYSCYKSQLDIKKRTEDWLGRLREAGIHIEPFCLTIDEPGPRLNWKELDYKWKSGDKKLYKKYQDLLHKCEGVDVFINWNGINLHPEFVNILPIAKVYSCYDDPESSDDLSKPVARHYDLCLVGNIAEVETYKSWGVKHAEFWPLGFFDEEIDKSITEEQILSDERVIDVSMLCERVSNWRGERLDKFTAAFPNGSYYGRGWPNGFLDDTEKLNLYRKTKIGLNIHNSTGPINFRTFMLPANGVMLLCDNKSYLSKLYVLGEEAVGFDTIEEAIELCKYYLEHDDKRKKIAVAGWKRAVKDYNEIAAFNMGIKHIQKLTINELTRKKTKESCDDLNRKQCVNRVKFYSYRYKLNIAQRLYRKVYKKWIQS